VSRLRAGAAVDGNSDPKTANSVTLSILIPAFRYAEGVQRILERLRSGAAIAYEIIVFDDSDGSEVLDTVTSWIAQTGLAVTYRKNSPALGAPANWNALIDAASGQYCLLLHHDEIPLSERFVDSIVGKLRRDSTVDVLVLDCVLVNDKLSRVRRHLPNWFRNFVITRAPSYLFRRNVIGPTSTLVVRRSLYPKFDMALRWLVDVEAYVRLFGTAKHVSFCPRLVMGSLLRRRESITSEIKPVLRELARKERDYLRERYPEAHVWLGSGRGSSLSTGFLRVCESVLWIVFRSALRAQAVLARSMN